MTGDVSFVVVVFAFMCPVYIIIQLVFLQIFLLFYIVIYYNVGSFVYLFILLQITAYWYAF